MILMLPPGAYSELDRRRFGLMISLPLALVLVVIYVLLILYTNGPSVCMVLSLWRLAHRDYGTADGDGSKANLSPALVIFYSLVLCQGALFLIWANLDADGDSIVESVQEQCRFPAEWGSASVAEYLLDSRAKCGRDPASTKGRNLISYAVGLLDSESPEGYLSGARMLDAFISQGEDVRPLLLASGPKIQKLIGTLGLRSCSANSTGHIRDLAARIVAHLAADIHLVHFPGATRCITSLLETTQPPHCNNQQAPHDLPPQDPHDLSPKSCLDVLVSYLAKNSDRVAVSRQTRMYKAMDLFFDSAVGQRRAKKSKNDDREAGSCNQLVLQGLEILERLACDQHNCRDICSTHGLLPKIMAPLYSDTLIEDIKISVPWAEVVNRSFKVVHQLVRTPGWTGRRLRREITGNNQAMSNLEKILESSEAGHKLQMRAMEIMTEPQMRAMEIMTELQMQAMEIMTELALDLSVNLTRVTKENLMKKQLQIFLADKWDEKQLRIFLADKWEEKQRQIFLADKWEEKLKATAGRTLTFLCKSETNSEFITRNCNDIVDCLPVQNDIVDCLPVQNDIVDCLPVQKDIVDRLTEILDAKNNIKYRTTAAEILVNLCTHCTLDKKRVKETILPKVLVEILTSKREPPTEASQSNISAPGDDEENLKNSALGDDEEKQLRIHDGQNKSSDQANMMEFQETLLRLALVTCDKLIGVDCFDLVGQESAFVAKLKTIVDENCQATPVSLRIVKLCGQIAVSMMRCSEYTKHFKDQKFKESLSQALGIMSNLESCMLFAGTDGGVNKAVRPLLSNLEKEVLELVGKLEVNND